MKRSALLVLILLSACEKKPVGFGLEDASIRYEHKAFADENVLAEANGQTYLKSQILDKSPVLKDLAVQKAEAEAGLAYLQVRDRAAGRKGVVEMHLSEPKSKWEAVLNRFGATPAPGLTVSWHAERGDGVVATFHDLTLKREDLDQNNAVLQAIEQRRYREVAAQLNAQLTRILLAETANREKTDLQTYLKKNVFGGREIEVTEGELRDYLATIGFAESELTQELRPRFEASIKERKEQRLMEKFVADTILKGPIAVAFEAPAARDALSDRFRPVMGYVDAPITIVAFSGATCNDCGKFITDLYGVMKDYDGYLKLNWIHTYNQTDGVAGMMARASLCVDSVRPGRSLAFMNAFVGKAAQVDENAFYQWGEKNRVDRNALKTCFTETQNDPLLAQHQEYARRSGIVANPTIVIEGQMLQGVIPRAQLEAMVRDSIRTKDASWFKAKWRHLKGWING